MQYLLRITRENDLVFERALTADEVIDFMRPQIAAGGGAPGPEAPAATTGKRAYTKRDKTEKPVKTGKRTTTCKKCGQQGHISKTCTNDPADPIVAARPPARMETPITKEQYEEIRELMYRKELTSMDIAAQVGVPEPEVKIALVSDNYHNYRAKRHAKS